MVRVGSVGYAVSQGLGHLMKDFYDAGAIRQVIIYEHPNGRQTRTEWYPAGTPIVRGRKFVHDNRSLFDAWFAGIDVLLCFETPHDWNLVAYARERGVKTVLMTMYEWSLLNPPYQFDAYLCPSLLDLKYFPTGTFIPVPAPSGTWKRRTKALRFLHNAGHVGAREHKGTRELVLAVQYVRSKVDLTIRSQNVEALRKLSLDPRVRYELGEVPRGSLHDGFDVYVAPEKFNGLSLPLQEAYAAGMFVMTTDRFPTNTWLPKAGLIPYSATWNVQVMGGHNVIEECVVEPKRIAEEIDRWHGQDIGEFSELGRQWADENSWDRLRPRYQDYFRKVAGEKV